MKNEALIAEVIRLRESGATYKEIAEATGVTQSYAYRLTPCDLKNKAKSLKWRLKPLAHRMAALNMSADDLAELTGMKRHTIYRILRGQQTPKLMDAAKIARAVKLSIEEAFGIAVC